MTTHDPAPAGSHAQGGSGDWGAESAGETARSGEGSAASGANQATSGSGSAGAQADQAESGAEPTRAGPTPAEGEERGAGIASVGTRAAWGALDRRDDPTLSSTTHGRAAGLSRWVR